MHEPPDSRHGRRRRPEQRHAGRGLVRLLRRDAQSACRSNILLDAAGRTSSTSPPIARNATSGWAGPATPRSTSAPPRCNCGRAGVLHQVAGRSGRRPARGRPVPDGRPGEGGRGRRRAGLGRRRRDLPLDDLRSLRRPARAGAALRGDDALHRVLPQAQHARPAAARAVPLLRRLAEHQGRHAQGRDLHGLLRLQHDS